jgi:hypothetical protein
MRLAPGRGQEQLQVDATTSAGVPSALDQLLARGRVRATLAMLGPAFVASAAYVDPGNFTTNIQAGAQYGYLLLWVVLAANLMAMLVQYLSAKLGTVTDRSLPELVRERFSRPVTWGMWAQAEVMAMATDAPGHADQPPRRHGRPRQPAPHGDRRLGLRRRDLGSQRRPAAPAASRPVRHPAPGAAGTCPADQEKGRRSQILIEATRPVPPRARPRRPRLPHPSHCSRRSTARGQSRPTSGRFSMIATVNPRLLPEIRSRSWKRGRGLAVGQVGGCRLTL